MVSCTGKALAESESDAQDSAGKNDAEKAAEKRVGNQRMHGVQTELLLLSAEYELGTPNLFDAEE